MIPKRIFFYWGGTKLSWMRYMTLYSFRKFNPYWEIVLYLSNNVGEKKWLGVEKQDYLEYNGVDYIDKIKDLNVKIKNINFDEFDKLNKLNPVHQSDMFRYYELYKNGGFYCDMDVLFFKSIDNFYNKIKDYDTIIHQNKNYITIGFLGSSENNQYFKDIFNFGLNDVKDDNYQSYGVDLIYKLFNGNRSNPLIFNKINDKYKDLKIKNINDNLIYKYDWTKINLVFSNSFNISDFDNESIGYHWFGGSPISQKYNNILNENNYMEYNMTFVNIVKKILENE